MACVRRVVAATTQVRLLVWTSRAVFQSAPVAHARFVNKAGFRVQSADRYTTRPCGESRALRETRRNALRLGLCAMHPATLWDWTMPEVLALWVAARCV